MINQKKQMWYLILCVITLGIIHVVSIFKIRLYLELVCNRCDIHDTDYFLIEDTDENVYYVRKTLENYYTRNFKLDKFIKQPKMSFKEELRQSKYIGIDYSNSSEESIVIKIFINLDSEL